MKQTIMSRVATGQVAMLLFACALVLPGCAGQSLYQDAMVRRMLAARERQIQITPLTHTFGAFSMEEAYRMQKALAQEVSALLGPVAGYKVAYASRVAQEQFGIDEPARGPFYLMQRVPSGSILPAEAFNEITLETEIAFTIGKRIDKPVANVATLKSHVKWVHAAFDAGDFPFKTERAKPVPADMVAIGTGAHVFVFGPGMDPERVDIDRINLDLIRNGEKIRSKPATDIMGSPWNSLLWCANHLHKYGLTLEPGMVVFSGTAAKAYRATGAAVKGRYVGDCGPLGKTTMTI
ncbi:MAG: fumarylacetoacetate hydrolase family protein, partial [Phycisphaerales bacterium]